MAAPSDENESTTISMVVGQWKKGQMEQISRVHRINGYPWRLRVFSRIFGERCVTLICEKSREAELWQCAATIKHSLAFEEVTHTFMSWHLSSQELFLASCIYSNSFTISIDIKTKEHGESWTIRPMLRLYDAHDAIFVIGEEKKKITVNKKFLASLSPFFKNLFFGDLKDNNETEFPIDIVEYEEFHNIIRMVYGVYDCSLKDDNVQRMLELADIFQLKIVEDRIVSFLLSSASFYSIHEKLLIADQFDLRFLKNTLFSWYNTDSLKDLNESSLFQHLSYGTLETLFDMYSEIDL